MEGELSCLWTSSQGRQSLPLFHPVSSAARGQKCGTEVKVILSVGPPGKGRTFLTLHDAPALEFAPKVLLVSVGPRWRLQD